MLNRKTLTVLTLVVAVLLIVRPEILGSIFALIFLGLIPGTDWSIPSLVMFPIYAVVAIITLYWLIRQPLYIGNMSRQEKTARALARKKVLKTKTKKKPVRKSAARRAKRTAQA
jgi:hypothetical protein